MHKYACEFTVVGRGHVPPDMLRYDRCTPLTEAAATKMIPNLVNGNQTSIRMVCYTETQRQGPTAGRWESFGWQVKDIKYRKLTGSAKHTKPA